MGTRKINILYLQFLKKIAWIIEYITQPLYNKCQYNYYFDFF